MWSEKIKFYLILKHWNMNILSISNLIQGITDKWYISTPPKYFCIIFPLDFEFSSWTNLELSISMRTDDDRYCFNYWILY